MRVIIVGAGEVGYNIAKFLASEKIDIVMIDRDGEKLRSISEELDIATIEGEGSDPSVFKEAGAKNADILIAVTNSDETNMIACLLGKALFNVKRRIARIRNPDYFFNKELLGKNYLDIDPAINPELETANAILRILEIPFATEVIEFEGGKVVVAGLKIPKQSKVNNKELKYLRSIINKDFIIGIIERNEEIIVPRGEDVLKEGDIIYIPLKREEALEISQAFGIFAYPTKKVMIVGGGRIGYYIARALEEKVDVKIIEKNEEKCKFLSKHLKKSLILHGDGTDKQLLIEENIKDIDAYITVSGNDEMNIMAALLAKKLGAKKVIALVNKTDYIPLAYELGIQSVLSSRLLTASIILRYIRKGDVLSLTAVAENKVEIMEVLGSYKSSIINKALKDINFPKNAVIGAIVRGGEIIIPKGDDVIKEGDKLIIFALKDSIKNIENLLT
ncbi:MAG: Trk/Ktr K+ transport system regulatory component TrkA/KtrA/KtrC [Thermodesulfobacteria bacterium]|nr:Trk system potassium transporter TrkA [Thermodesulfobacteriota bacterium]MCU4138672.1 Trk/Ktr K+ transport system regulatory component TrkA/KtrA/KtrC [Thermodesulfobacteriota bacterium]